MRTGTRHEGRLIWVSAEARSLLWRIASLILLFNGLLVVWVLLKPGSDAVVAIVVNVAEFVGPLLVVPLCFGGLRRLWRRGTSRTDKGTAVTIGQRWAPVLLGIGILSFAFGLIVFTYYEWVLQQAPPLPSLADVGFQIQYPFLLLGILLLSARPIPAASRARIALDGLMIMTALVTLSWYFVLGPLVQQEGETTLAKAVAMAQPLADVVLVACLLILASRPSEHTLRPALRLLALGLTLVVVADSNFTYQMLHDTYATGTLIDVGWPLGYMLVALGAFVAWLAPTGETATSPDEPDYTPCAASPLAEQRVWRSLLPYVLVPVVGILVVYVWRTATGSDNLAAGVYVGGALLIGLVLLRQVFTIVENARLYNRLLAYVRNVDRVTDAAAAVEAGEFDPETIAQVAARRDELGRLARVFQQMAREVRAREQRLKRHRAVVDAALDAIVTMSADGLIRSFNHSAELTFGYTAEEAIGQRLEMLMPERFRKMHRAGLRRYLNTGEARVIGQPRLELAGRRKDGSEFPLELSISETREGEDILFIGIVRDITERKRSEEALKQSERRFRQLFEHSIDAVFVHDEEGRIVDCNAEACRSLLYTREELLALNIRDIATDLISEEEKRTRKGKTLWERAMRSSPGEIVGFDQNNLWRKDGTTFLVEVGVGVIDYGGQRLILASARDITERKRSEEELKESEERFKRLAEATFEGVAITQDGKVVETNASFAAMFGYESSEVIGMTPADFHPPESQGVVRSARSSRLEDPYEVV